MIKILLDNGADGVEGLVACGIYGVRELILFFLEYGIDVNARASVPQLSGLGHRTALEMACAENDPAVVRILLDHGADPNIRSHLAKSALEAYLNRLETHAECESGPIFVLLLGSDADLRLVREDKLKGEAKSIYLTILDRWKEWKVDDSISPLEVLGEYRRSCLYHCACDLIRSESDGGKRCYRCVKHY